MKWLQAGCQRYFRHYQGLSKTCWAGIICSLLQALISGIFYFLTFYFVNDLQFSMSVTGIIVGGYGVGAVLGGYGGGKLSDKFSPISVSVVSLLIQALAILNLIYLKNQLILMANLFLMGVGTYAFITANHVLVLSSCLSQENERLRAINVLSTVTNLGLGLSTLMIGVVARFGFINLFAVLSAALVTMALYLLITKEDYHQQVCAVVQQKAPLTKKKKWNRALFQVVLLCVLLTGTVVAQMSTTYPIYLQARFPQFGMHAYSAAFFVNTLLVILLQTPLVNAVGKRNKVAVMGLGAFLLGAGMMCLNFINAFAGVLLLCAIYTAGEMIFFSMAQLNCYQEAPLRKRGRNLGLYRMTFAASRVAGPVMGGFIYQHLGAHAVWYACGMLGTVCLLVCGLFLDQQAA